MASTGKKGKKNKGKTVPLNDFLSNNSTSWSDAVDEPDKLGDFIRKPALPAAPRAARALELDESRIPKNPPYVAYLSNLSYELEEADILNAFVDLSISNVRLPRDEHTGRLKGFGYVDFNDRSSFISALQKHEATIRGRRIKIDVAENEGERRRGGMRGNRDRESNYDSEKTLGDWRSGPRSEFSSNDDRRGPMSGKKDYGGFRDRDRDRDGYDKSRGDRESSWRDSDRRFGSDSRGSYGSRRNYDEPESNYSEPKTRQKLNLKPRKLPLEDTNKEESKKEEEGLETEKASSASIFGQAKPVDTAAREREIEQRLEKEREIVKKEKDVDKPKSKTGDEDSSSEAKGGEGPAHEPKENVWVRRSQRPEAQNVTPKQPSDEKTNGDPDEEPPSRNESEKETLENSEDSSRYPDSKRNDDYDNDRDADSRYGRYPKNDNRYNDRNRDSDRNYRREDRWRDDKDRRDRKDYDRRDRGYDSDRRGGSTGGRTRDLDRDRDGDSRRYNDREGDSRRYNDRDGDYRRYNDRDTDSRRYNDRDGDLKRFSNDREGDWRKYSDKDGGDNKRSQERDGGRYRDQEDHGNNKGVRGDKRSASSGGDKGSRPTKSIQERERGPQNKDKPREQKKPEDGLRMPKFKEAAAPNYIGTNMYSFLEEDGVSE